MYSKKILPEVERFVKPTYKEIKIWSHGWLHILGVVKAAKELAELEGAGPVLCQIAVYCHDMGRLEEERKNLANHDPGTPSAHAVMSVKPTKEILKKSTSPAGTRQILSRRCRFTTSKNILGQTKSL